MSEPPEMPRRVFLLLQNRLLRDALKRLLSRRPDLLIVGCGKPETCTSQMLVEAECEVLVLSAKRYALFLKDPNGTPALLRKEKSWGDDRWSEHGLGHLLNPIDPDSEDREWIAQVWLNILKHELGFKTTPLEFEERPAIGRISVSSPMMMRPFENLNRNKKYTHQIKPFNFLLSCHINELGHPPGVDAEHFHLIAPYDKNPKKWMKQEWIDEYSGKSYGIKTWGKHGDRFTARVKTYHEVLEDYKVHPESKCADAEGKICDKETVGLVQRRHVQIKQFKFIGKESNSFENVEAGLEHPERNVYTEYIDPKRDEWTTETLPALKKARLIQLVEACRGKLSRRAIIDLRAGRGGADHRKDIAIYSLKCLETCWDRFCFFGESCKRFISDSNSLRISTWRSVGRGASEKYLFSENEASTRR
jgi:hypothetical protein